MEVKEMVRKGQNINAHVYKGQVIIIPGGGGGEIDPEAIKSAVDEYLEANPPAQGAPGKTPVKGVDYFTPEEVQEIAEQAAEMVEVPEGGGSSDWIPLIDVTLEEPVVYVSADVDINGKPFSVKEIYYAVKLIKEPENANARYLGFGVPNHNSTTVQGVSYMVDVKTDNVFHGLITLCGTQLRAVSSYRGSNEYGASGQGPYGGVLSGRDMGVTELTRIAVGFTSAANQMLAGSVIKVWGR